MLFSNWPTSAIFFEVLLWLVVIVCAIFIWRGSLSFRVLGIIGICGIIWCGFIEPSLLITRENSISNKELAGLRLGIASDLHVGPYVSQGKISRIVAKFNEAKVDMVLIPGDFLHGKASDFADKLAVLSMLEMPWYFSLGNHDHKCDSGDPGTELLREKLAEFKGIELNNSSLQLRDNLWLAGVDDNYLGFDDLTQAFRLIPESSEVILLAHSPDIIRQEDSKRASLIISGHTHGGQIRMPWGSLPFVIPVKEKHYDRGYFSSKKILVTSGVGEVGTRARFLNPPEIRIVSFE